MTPRQVRSVLAVMELGSVQRAAQALHLAPSSVSAQIRELGHELGVNLFESCGRGLVPSDAAHYLKPSFMAYQQLVESIRQQANSIQHEPAGVLKLYAPSSMCIYRLPALIEALQASAPQVEVVLTHEPFDYQRALLQADIEAALTVTETLSAEWANTPLAIEEVVYVCHPQRYANVTSPVHLEQLIQQPLITTEPGCTYRVHAEAHFRAAGLQLKPRQAFANVEVIRRCLFANMGIGLLPLCVVADDIKTERLLALAVEGTPYRFYSNLIYPAQRKSSPKLQALIQVIEAQSSVI